MFRNLKRTPLKIAGRANNNKTIKPLTGFTLIELLVVVAIIGILASIVFVSLAGARDRARDARIEADLGQLRGVAEMHKDDNNTYTGLNNDSGEGILASDINSQGGAYNLYINSNGNAYCAASALNRGWFWCVDSDLKSEKDADGTLTTCVSTCAAGNSCACD